MKSAPFQVGEQVEVQIERLAHGGAGVGRIQNFIVFCPFTAPQERALVRIIEIKKSYALAELVQVLSPSPWRTEPICPVFGSCGGCSFQHVQYEEQLRQKQSYVRHELQRSLSLEQVEFEPIQASPLPWRYRNRIQLRIDRGHLGFFERGSHRVVDISDCEITDRRLTDCFSSLREEYADAQTPVKIELGLNSQGKVASSINKFHGEELGFSQVNPAANTLLIAHVVKMTCRYSPLRLFDLYCGKGNFTFPLAKGRTCVGVETNASAIAQADARLKQEAIPNLSFVCADVAAFIGKQTPSPGTGILMDPPRVGCEPDVLRGILKLAPEILIYVSCNPSTFRRDAEILLSGQLKLKSIKPFDLFPQTDHVEIVAVFCAAT